LSATAQYIADVEARETPLHWASEHGQYTIALKLIENGAPVNVPDQFGRTPLFVAVRYPEMVVLLLEAGADPDLPDMFGRTPLHAALQYPETVALLIGAGASLTEEDHMGNTPLERTLRFGTRSRNIEVIMLLLDAGAGGPKPR
jgi:ankyrin repeat protein